jgi:O-antigen/teichoic acid export membrane protein
MRDRRLDRGAGRRPGAVSRREGLVRSAVTVLLTYAGTALFTGLLTLYLVRALGATTFGVFSLAMSIAGLAAILIDFGIGSSAGRFMAERIDDNAALARIFATALRLKLVTGVAVAILLLVLAAPIAAAYDEPALTWPIRALALSTLLQSIVGQISTQLLAISQTAANLRMIYLEGATEFVASVTLVVTSGGATAAAAGRTAGYAVGAVAGLVIVLRLLGRRALVVHRRDAADVRVRDMGSYALWLWVAGSAYLIYVQVDAIIIGAMLGSTAVGAFSAPLRLSVFLAYPSLAVGNVIAPRFARAARGEIDAPPDLHQPVRWLLVVQSVIAVPLVVWARPIVDLVLGRGYADSVAVVRVLAAFIFVQGFAPLLSLTANFLGEAKRRVPWALGTVVVNVAIDLALLRSIGVEAAAIASSVAIAIYVAGHWMICRQLVVLRAAPVLWTFARCVVAAEAMAAVLLVFGTNDLSALDWVAGLAGGLAAYAVVLVVLGEFTRGELRRAQTALRRLGAR